MKAAWGMCIALALVSPASAENDACTSIEAPRTAIQAKQGSWITVTTDQWEFLRGVYVLNPNTPPGLPPGDRAVLAQVEGDGGGIIFFIDGDLACTPMVIPAMLVKMLREVDADAIPHAGDGL